MGVNESIYERKGYVNREDYLECLADDYGVPFSMVKGLAEALGPVEDFDGLVSEIQDLAEMVDY